MNPLSNCLCVNLSIIWDMGWDMTGHIKLIHYTLYIWCMKAAMAKLGANFLGICGILCLFVSYIGGSRVLLLPVMFKSLILEKLIVGDALVERGHEVHVLIDAEFSNISLMKGTKVKKIVVHRTTKCRYRDYSIPRDE